jgi:putative tricarboxylic transport membrane protein
MTFLDAIPILFTPFNLFLIASGVLIGVVVGIIPGLSAAMAVALLIPFTYDLEPINGMAMLVAVFVGGISGGSITAVLLRIPGTPSSVATLLDGYPMASGGQAGRAIGLAVFSSMVGTLISAAILIVAAPLAAAFAVKFYFPEYVAVCIFGLTAIAALSDGSLIKGLFSALLGLFAATVGISQVDGLPRFDFEQDALLGGLNLLPALIGLFAVAQIMREASYPAGEKAKPVAMTDSVIPRMSDLVPNTWNFLRSGLIGTLVGVMPAMGGGPAGLIAYAQAKSAARKDPKQRYGTGAPGGIIAAETANNATIGGALIIMLTLGIPGDPVSAVLIGGLMIHGLQPGPQLFTQNSEVVYSIYLSMLVSSVLMAMILFSFSKALSRLAMVPGYILHPPLLLFATIGVYGLNNNLIDVWVMLGFGLLGYFLERLRVPLPPLVLGIVLGPILEGNLRKMVDTFGSVNELFTRPIALTFIVLTVISVAFSVYRQARSRAEVREGIEHAVE